MTQEEKKEFIRSMVQMVEDRLITATSIIPENWDGVELRWLIEGAFKIAVDGDRFGDKKRRRAFDNACMVKNIL